MSPVIGGAWDKKLGPRGAERCDFSITLFHSDVLPPYGASYMLNALWKLGSDEVRLLQAIPPMSSDTHSRLRIHSSRRVVLGGIHQPYRHSLSRLLNGKRKIAVVCDDYGRIYFTSFIEVHLNRVATVAAGLRSAFRPVNVWSTIPRRLTSFRTGQCRRAC